MGYPTNVSNLQPTPSPSPPVAPPNAPEPNATGVTQTLFAAAAMCPDRLETSALGPDGCI